MIVPFLDLLDSEQDKLKFTALYSRYENLMIWVAMKRLNNTVLAEESVQDAWLYIATHFDKVNKVDSKQTKAYVTTIADSFAVDKLRKEKKIISFPADSVVKDKQAEESFFEQTDALLIKTALQKIDPLYRDVLRLKYFFNYSSVEIGEMLGKKADYIRKLQQLARQELRKVLEEDEPT